MKTTPLCASVLISLALYAAAGFAASPKIDEAVLAGMRKGQTTFDEIVRSFGRPNFGSKNWDGTRTAAYAYSEGWSPNALSALGAALGGSTADTVVLYFDSKDVLKDYKINQAAAKPAGTPAAPALRYVEPSYYGGTTAAPANKPAATAVPASPTMRYVEPGPASVIPTPAAKPAAAAAATPVEATPLAPVPAGRSAAAPVSKPAAKEDGLPSWLPSSSTRENRY